MAAPIATSFTDAEDRLSEQLEMFKLGEQTCERKIMERKYLKKYAALKQFVMDIDVKHELTHLSNMHYAQKYVTSVKNLVGIINDENTRLMKKIAELEEEISTAEEQAEVYAEEAEEFEKTRDDALFKFRKLQAIYTAQKKKEKMISSNNKNVKHLIVLFYSMLIYTIINKFVMLL